MTRQRRVNVSGAATGSLELPVAVHLMLCQMCVLLMKAGLRAKDKSDDQMLWLVAVAMNNTRRSSAAFSLGFSTL